MTKWSDCCRDCNGSWVKNDAAKNTLLMERSYLLLLGALSGLVSVLLHAVLWSLLELVRPAGGTLVAIETRAAMARIDIPDILLHVLGGIGLGLIFWLSWGLAAVVSVPWWTRGLVFGGLAWAFVGLPAIISLARARSGALGATGVIALQWATTCVIAGLACAWSWERAA